MARYFPDGRRRRYGASFTQLLTLMPKRRPGGEREEQREQPHRRHPLRALFICGRALYLRQAQRREIARYISAVASSQAARRSVPRGKFQDLLVEGLP
jgi:hypothetical protein